MKNDLIISPNPYGFITDWLVSGPISTLYQVPSSREVKKFSQIEYEQYLRRTLFSIPNRLLSKSVSVGELSDLNEPWQYYYCHGNWFIDKSQFYSSLVLVAFDAVTELISERDIQVQTVIWTYAAATVWVNGEQICAVDTAVYKPITQKCVFLPLHKGINTIYVQIRNLGVRDTRNIFGLQLKNVEGIQVSLPDWEHALPYVELGNWLSSLQINNNSLVMPKRPSCTILLKTDQDSSAEQLLRVTDRVPLRREAKEIQVSGIINGIALSRNFEIIENIHKQYRNVKQNHKQEIYQQNAAIPWKLRSGGDTFSVYYVLARLAVHKSSEQDFDYLMNDLDLIEQRVDCADFLLIGFLRLVKKYKVDDRILSRMKQVLLKFRYWMDEDGSDGMCFWSENHALMFYGAQMIAGSLYPDDVFACSGRTGRQQQKLGQERCCQWLDDIEKNGFEEFMSGDYTCVTITALLNLVDFAPDDLSKRATVLLDRQLTQLAIHTFHGSVIAPQGRVYRDVLYPFCQNVQSLINFINPETPFVQSMWISCFATTKYKIYPKLKELMEKPISSNYSSGNARIIIKKTSDYMLTSVLSPRAANEKSIWRNDRHENNDYISVKLLNERFHGTTLIQPGVFGYQQHLWYAALSNECVIFVNNPGSSSDFGQNRPGYWYGNGIFPAILQKENILGVVYSIPDSYPIHFTHVFWPTSRFDETIQRGSWLFGRLGESYVALWCSGRLGKFNDVLFNCEYRCYSSRCAYVCICSCQKECGEFKHFITNSIHSDPLFDKDTITLKVSDLDITYKQFDDKTQYI
jgi:hypothetical protein